MKKITDRILIYLKYRGISKYQFHKDLGLSNGFLDKSRDIGTDKYAKILEYFDKVNPEWLLTGKGTMLKTEDTKPDKTKPPPGDCDNCKEKERLISSLEKIISTQEKTISAQDTAIKSLEKHLSICEKKSYSKEYKK